MARSMDLRSIQLVHLAWNSGGEPKKVRTTSLRAGPLFEADRRPPVSLLPGSRGRGEAMGRAGRNRESHRFRSEGSLKETARLRRQATQSGLDRRSYVL